jgi:hypothetical protein
MSPTAVAESIPIGVTGQQCRASVTAWGDITAHVGPGDNPTLKWFVAADDRWHAPSEEAAVRQRRIDGTPVIETRLRIPDGDAVQRVWSVADSGGLTVIEIENDSPLPFAVAFSGLNVVSERPPADIPIQGIDLPPGSVLMPVGHHATIRVAIPHLGSRVRPSQLSKLPSSLAVARGWLAVVHRASRLVLPDDALVDAVTAARCDLLLDGPVEQDTDQVGFLFDVAELGRLGDHADAWMPEIVDPIAKISRSSDPEVDVALESCERLALSADDNRAASDIARLRTRRARDELMGTDIEARRMSFSDVRRGASVGRFVSGIERQICDEGDILPSGIPSRWLGDNFEVHGIPTGPRSSVSFAVRWHGERPAALWEQRGDVCRLSAPSIDSDWSTEDRSGEVLWAAPPTPTKLGLIADNSDSDSTSFG